MLEFLYCRIFFSRRKAQYASHDIFSDVPGAPPVAIPRSHGNRGISQYLQTDIDRRDEGLGLTGVPHRRSSGIDLLHLCDSLGLGAHSFLKPAGFEERDGAMSSADLGESIVV